MEREHFNQHEKEDEVSESESDRNLHSVSHSAKRARLSGKGNLSLLAAAVLMAACGADQTPSIDLSCSPGQIGDIEYYCSPSHYNKEECHPVINQITEETMEVGGQVIPPGSFLCTTSLGWEDDVEYFAPVIDGVIYDARIDEGMFKKPKDCFDSYSHFYSEPCPKKNVLGKFLGNVKDKLSCCGTAASVAAGAAGLYGFWAARKIEKQRN